MISLRQTFAVVCLLLIGGMASARFAEADDETMPLHQRIDELIGERLATLQIRPAEVSSDAEFMRRAYLDLTGVIPTAKQALAFLDDSSPEKRQRLIDDLLASPDYAIHMARVFDVILIERRIPTIKSYDISAPNWLAYLAGRFAENKPWDQMVRDILSSDGSDEGNAAGVKFYLVRDVSPHQLTRDVGRLFLGADFQCAQCHDDPYIASYRQADYFGLYAFLQRVAPFRDSDKNMSLVGESAVGQASFVSVFTAKSGETNPRLPGGEMIADPDVEKDQEYVVKPGPKERGVPTYSRRLKLAELLPRAETQGFSRNIVNRLWAMLMGRGLVHPLDLHHANNAPSHPELLDCLERWLSEHQFDLKALMREILLSQTYQRSSVLPEGVTELPGDAFAVAPLRGLSPEQLSWSLLQATGRIEQHFSRLDSQPALADSNPGEVLPAWKLRLTRLEPLERQTRLMVAVFAGLPGQPDGNFQPVVDHALHLLNNSTMLSLLRDEPSTLLKRLTAISEPEPLAEELYLSVLSRRPSAVEVAQVRQMIEELKTPAERQEPLTALIWGLLLSSEFRLNH